MINELIQNIETQQAAGDRFFMKGLFFAFRMNTFWNYVRPDNNVFTSLSTAFILKQYLSELQGEAREKAASCVSGVIQCLPVYRNKDGRNTYNFWQHHAKAHFPYGRFMRHLRHFKLPDDIDDTALSFLVKGYTAEEVAGLRQLLATFAHPDGVYDTWFGVNMPKERDVCALCNLMYLLLESDPELSSNDLATLAYMNEVIISGKYLSDTFWVSRHYASVPLIVYHYSRILSRFKIKALDSARQELAERLPQLYEAETEATGLLLLEIAARRLQVPLPEIKTGVRGEFYSFIGAPFAPLKSPVFQAAAPSPRAWIGWKCPAHELALRLENELLKNR